MAEEKDINNIPELTSYLNNTKKQITNIENILQKKYRFSEFENLMRDYENVVESIYSSYSIDTARLLSLDLEKNLKEDTDNYTDTEKYINEDRKKMMWAKDSMELILGKSQNRDLGLYLKRFCDNSSYRGNETEESRKNDDIRKKKDGMVTLMKKISDGLYAAKYYYEIKIKTLEEKSAANEVTIDTSSSSLQTPNIPDNNHRTLVFIFFLLLAALLISSAILTGSPFTAFSILGSWLK